MLIQNHVRHDSIIASQRLAIEFCNTIGPSRTSCDVGVMSALEGRNRLDMLSQRFSESDPKLTFTGTIPRIRSTKPRDNFHSEANRNNRFCWA